MLIYGIHFIVKHRTFLLCISTEVGRKRKIRQIRESLILSNKQMLALLGFNGFLGTVQYVYEDVFDVEQYRFLVDICF